MPTQRQHPLPYFENSALLFESIVDSDWSVFLDSGYPYTQQGRYDILAAEPKCTLVTRGLETEITQHGKTVVSTENPFDLLQQTLPEKLSNFENLPFNGGVLGYFSYDLSRRLERFPILAKDAENIPEMAVGIYHWAVIVDHHKQQSWLVGVELPEQQWLALIKQFSQINPVKNRTPFQVLSKPQSNMSRAVYQSAFEKIKHYLTEGDCYQVNLTQRFESICTGHPWQAYQHLRQINAAPFSAYLNLPDVQILSSSPERFLEVQNNKVETKPIKGTRPRKQNLQENQQQIEELRNSPKDRAENVMIVDLLRNDISKTCAEGSVKVPKLFDIETYKTVHHLVSTVTGELPENKHAVDLLKSCFPGGSITGAPKVRAMEIIEEIEPNRRGVYCGSIGYIGFDGNMDTNIAIRTLVYSENKMRFWAGGGIVNDSDVDEEYQESFDKAAAMLALLAEFTSCTSSN